MVAGSFAFGFALVPLYKRDLRGGRHPRERHAVRGAVAVEAGAGRKVTLEFMSLARAGQRLRARAGDEANMVLQPGRLYEAKFRIRNNATRPVVAQAVPSIAPSTTAKYLQKTECFCFTPQSFGAAEEREFTVRFIVEPGPAGGRRPDDARVFDVRAARRRSSRRAEDWR